jgi:hypothetical protein
VVLGISARFAAQHYDRGAGSAAGAAFLTRLDADKEEARELLRQMRKSMPGKDGYSQAAYEQIYSLSLMPRAYLRTSPLEAFD